MDYNKKKKELEEKFNKIKEEIQIFQNTLNEKQQELLRFQGEYRLLQELEKDSIIKP